MTMSQINSNAKQNKSSLSDNVGDYEVLRECQRGWPYKAPARDFGAILPLSLSWWPSRVT
jgi:hypothetical protein